MDVKQIERLEAWLRIAPDMGGCFELPEDCRDDIDALLQLARAVSDLERFRPAVKAWQYEGEKRYFADGVFHLEVGPNYYRALELLDELDALAGEKASA